MRLLQINETLWIDIDDILDIKSYISSEEKKKLDFNFEHNEVSKTYRGIIDNTVYNYTEEEYQKEIERVCRRFKVRMKSLTAVQLKDPNTLGSGNYEWHLNNVEYILTQEEFKLLINSDK